MTLKIKNIAFLFAAAVALLTACREDSSFSGEVPVADIVLLSSQKPDGTVFEIQPPRSSSVITLTTGTAVASDRFSEGDFVYIRYIPVEHPVYTSGPVELLAVQAINNLAGELGSRDDYDPDAQQPLEVLSEYTQLARLVLYIALPYSTLKQQLRLIVDENSLGNPTPRAWLSFTADGTIAPSFNRNYYFAFDLKALREQYGFKTLEVFCYGTRLGTTSFKTEFF